MRLFFKSEIDHRKLTQPWFEILAQHPGRREHVYGRIHAQSCKCSACRKIAA